MLDGGALPWLVPKDRQRLSVDGACVQELQTPELQPLSMESKAALALLKYLPLNPHVIPQVTPYSHRHHFFAMFAAVSVNVPFRRKHCMLLTKDWAKLEVAIPEPDVPVHKRHLNV